MKCKYGATQDILSFRLLPSFQLSHSAWRCPVLLVLFVSSGFFHFSRGLAFLCFTMAFRGFRGPLSRPFERPLKASIKGLDRVLTSHTKVLGRRLSTYYKIWTYSATSFGTSYYFTCLYGLLVYPWLFAQPPVCYLLSAVCYNEELSSTVSCHLSRLQRD